MFNKNTNSTLNISFTDIQRPAVLEILTNVDFFPVLLVSSTLILEPIECQSAEEGIVLKQKWRHERHLSRYGMALDLEITFNEMLRELEMTED